MSACVSVCVCEQWNCLFEHDNLPNIPKESVLCTSDLQFKSSMKVKDSYKGQHVISVLLMENQELKLMYIYNHIMVIIILFFK